jgi:hypothetical protein
MLTVISGAHAAFVTLGPLIVRYLGEHTAANLVVTTGLDLVRGASRSARSSHSA